ncbi:hypothetical protein AgCh_004511 [Apium graveolens]
MMIKFGSVKLAKKYMKRVTTELHIKGTSEKDFSMDYMLLQGVRFAFRIHQFAGGFDAKTMHAFEELRNLALVLSKSNGKEICVVDGHPQFAQAKREEKARLKQEKKQAILDAKKAKQKKGQVAILAKLQAVKPTQQIPSQPSGITKSQDPKKQVETEQKKSPRYKKLAKRTKRKLNFVGKELEDQFPKESTSTTTQASKPTVVFEDIKMVDPYRNIHGEPIVPKDEPIDWESLPIPDFNLPILSNPKRTKSRAVKKVKLSPLKSKSLV